jgi:hypothetical protein
LAIQKLTGVKSVDATGAREGDAFVYLVESLRGSDVRRPLFNLCAQNGWPIIGLAPVGTDLESVFIRLVDKSEEAPAARQGRRARK